MNAAYLLIILDKPQIEALEKEIYGYVVAPLGTLFLFCSARGYTNFLAIQCNNIDLI
jgi:hypothetical protein